MSTQPSPSVVVVTGATSGVGRATARLFAQGGASVALLARGEDALEATADELRALPGASARILTLAVDVGDAQAVEDAAAQVTDQLGDIDAWVNNAMTGALGPFLDLEADAFEAITRTTYLGVVNGTRAALSRMVPRGRGTVVQVGSALAYRGIPLQSAYCGAKHAIQGFTESVRCELLHDESPVHITMVQLPAVNTPQFGMVRNAMPKHPMPVPPIFSPEACARAIVWSASHRRRELLVGPNTAIILAGNALAPGLGDRYLAKTGYDGQQSDMDPTGNDYVFEPVAGDHGEEGKFSDEQHDRDPWSELTMALDPVTRAVTGVGVRVLGAAGLIKG